MAAGKIFVIETALSHRFQVGAAQKNIVTVTKQDNAITIGGRPLDRSGTAVKRPNILVLTAHDWSWPHAGIVGDDGVRSDPRD